MRAHTLVFLAVVGAGCKSEPAGGGGGMPPGGMPPTDVGVVTLKAETVALQEELAGRTAASQFSEVRPQVTGLLKARRFEEGAQVKAGQVLYDIDASMYRATYAQATADLQSAKAQLESTTLRDERYQGLIKIEGVSKQEAEDAHASHQQAVAAVAQKQAALEAARINVGYTSIVAPIAGRISRSAVTPGALVTAGQPTPLATIRSLDPIYVDLTQSNEARLRLRAALGQGAVTAGSTDVKLRLADGSLYPRTGKLEFSEVAVDETTGTVTLRAKFPNPDETLLPGMYVRAVLDQATAQQAILAPQQGITHDAKGNATAMVVGPDNKVELRTLVADRAIGDKWLVASGLKEGDRLIVEGLNKTGPGATVKPTEIVPGAKAAPGGAPGASGGAPPAEAAAPAAGSAAGAKK